MPGMSNKDAFLAGMALGATLALIFLCVLSLGVPL